MKIYIKSTQSIFAGTRYDKQAAKILEDSGMFSEEESKEIINKIFREYIHAFAHAPNWTEKYLKGIARMCVEESGGSRASFFDFLQEAIPTFESFITFAKLHRHGLSDKLDSQFNDNMDYMELENFVDEQQSYADLYKTADSEIVSDYDPGTSDYTLIPIESYEDFNKKFGGLITGDGKDIKTAWCYANDPSQYPGLWYRCYVLAKNDYKNIKFDAKSNAANPKDAYGNSLICILVNKYNGKLMAVTLRCNHVGTGDDADVQYRSYAELSQVVGFNVKAAMKQYLDLPDVDNLERFMKFK